MFSIRLNHKPVDNSHGLCKVGPGVYDVVGGGENNNMCNRECSFESHACENNLIFKMLAEQKVANGKWIEFMD